LVAASVPLAAQTFTGDILGTVVDPQDAAVPGVNLVVRNLETNAELETTSQSDGRYAFSRLPPGRYTVTATAAGFGKYVSSDLTLNVGNRLTVNIQMTVADVTSAIEVTGTQELVQADDIVVGQVVSGGTIRELPLNGRKFLQLAQLAPGVIDNATAPSPSASWVGRQGLSIVVAGLRETDTSFLLDGVESRSARWGNTGFSPSVDAIQEFNVQRNAFTADQGWGTSVVNTVLRSGTNNFHGSAFYFIRNDALDARNFFDGRTKPPFKQNQLGATLGGPIVRDRLFFFGNYEGFRQRLTTTFTGSFPTEDELQGRFRTTVIDPLTGTPFPNNTIPGNRFDPVSVNVIPYYPRPNRPNDPTLNYARTASREEDVDQVHGKVDYILSNNDRMFFRYSWLDSPLLQPSLVQGFGTVRPIGGQNVALSYTKVFSPNVINELRLGYNRDRNYSVTESAFGPDLAKEIGLKNTSLNPASFGLPSFDVRGFSAIGQGFSANLEQIDQIYQLTENVTWINGKHDIRIGGDIRHNRNKFRSDFPSNPAFTFAGDFSRVGLGDFLLGFPTSYQTGLGDAVGNFRRTPWAVHVQDNYKVTPKLTLNIGLRYEYSQPAIEIDDKQGFFDFSRARVVTIADGWQRGLFYPDRNDFAPRFGFAYAVADKTVIRGGIGVYYDLIAGNEAQFRGLLMPPFWQIVADSATSTPRLQLSDLFPKLEFGQTNTPNTIVPTDRTPYVYQYNLNVQREISGVLAEVGYVGSTGHKLNRRVNQNLAYPAPNVPLALRRPYRGFEDIITSQNDSWSNYNGLNVRGQKRLANGLELLAAYTYGKHLDIAGPDEYVHGDSTGTLKDLRGPAQVDVRHRFVASYVYQLPLGRGKAVGGGSNAVDKLIGGWQVTGVTSFQSGFRLTPTGGSAQIGGRRINPANRFGPGNDSELRSNIRNQPTLFPYFRTQDFAAAPTGNVGNGGRGTISGPGLNNWDLGLMKNTPINERVMTQLRAEFFNIFNHAQFTALNVNVDSPSFGRITNARAPRDIQFGLKLTF
jgi:hypothetical protein